MYEVYQTSAPIIAYMQAFDDMALPLVIGEFGPQNNGQPVDVETVFAQAQQRGQWLHRLVLVAAMAAAVSYSTWCRTSARRLPPGANAS